MNSRKVTKERFGIIDDPHEENITCPFGAIKTKESQFARTFDYNHTVPLVKVVRYCNGKNKM